MRTDPDATPAGHAQRTGHKVRTGIEAPWHCLDCPARSPIFQAPVMRVEPGPWLQSRDGSEAIALQTIYDAQAMLRHPWHPDQLGSYTVHRDGSVTQRLPLRELPLRDPQADVDSDGSIVISGTWKMGE